MRFGVARDIVTPDVSMNMGGYGSLYDQQYVGVHDDLYVKALVMDDGKRKSLLIALDLIFHDFELTESIGRHIQDRHGINADNLIISYSHSHAGPAVRGFCPGQHSDEYEAFLAARIKSSIDRALLNMFEGTIEYGAIEGDWNMYRRKLVDGEWLNRPNPEGEKDNSLSILRIRDQMGKDKAVLVNYSCHPVTLSTTRWLSAEFPGRMCQLLEAQLYGATAMFFQSGGGCSRPRVSAGVNGWKKCDFGEVDEMSNAMANAVMRAIIAGAFERFELDLAARTFDVRLDIEPLPKEHFAKIAEDPDPFLKNQGRAILDRYDTMPNHLDVHAAVVRLSQDHYIAFLCGEPCYPIKRIVSEAFEGKKVIFIGYGDCCAYIPPDQYITEGGYEVDGSILPFTRKGRFKLGVDAKIREAFSRKFRELIEE